MAQQPPPYNPYPPQQQPGYPPATQPGYPPQQQAAYPPQQPGYDPSKAAYPGGAPPPQAGYPPQPQTTQATVTVVTQQPVVVQKPVFKDYPVTITLDNGQQVQTRLQYRAGLLTWLVCCGICWIAAAFGLIFGIIGIVAFFIDDLKDVYHLDPNGNVVGVYKRI